MTLLHLFFLFILKKIKDDNVREFAEEIGRIKVRIVKVKLKTGRHHQIRVQFSSRGYPLVGDRRYGNDKEDNIGLFAYQLSFIHPVKKEPICITAPVPNDSLWQQFAASVQ